MKICELLKRQCRNDNFAIVQNERAISYKEWNISSQTLAEKLNDANASNNIILLLPNSIEYAIAYFSIVFSNRVVIPLNYNSKSFEISNLLNYCESNLVITNSGYPYLDSLKNANIYLIDKDEFVFNNPPKVKESVIPDDVFIMLQTSGSIDDPKRVMLTNEGVIENIVSNNVSLSLDKNEVILIVLPMVFGYCNTSQFLTSVFLGAKLIVYDRPLNPTNLFSEIEKHKVTYTTLVPSLLYTLLNPSIRSKYKDIHIKNLCFGGAKPSRDKLFELFEAYPNIGFVQTYGQTECSPRLTTLKREDAFSRMDSVGRAIPNVEIVIQDSNGRILPPNTEGEICASGKNIMAGYYKNPKLTSKTIINGWLHTGDIGRIDDGFVYVSGRIKNIIIYNGINIFPEEIEGVLLMHPLIKEAKVFGEKNSQCGELPVASVVVDDEVSTKEIIQFCKKLLIEYKIPKKIIFVDEIEKTYNGKIRR